MSWVWLWPGVVSKVVFKGVAAILADEDVNVDLTAALKWLNAAVINSVGHPLREPEVVILKGTWRGLTYEQMAGSSDYSTNYLMRDVAPKLWKQLSSVFGRSVGKTNFRVALEAYAASTNRAIASEITASNFGFPADLPEDASYASPLAGPDEGSSRRGEQSSRAVTRAVTRTNDDRHPSLTREAGGLEYGRMVPAASEAVMYGYEDELAQIERWISSGSGEGQLIGLWGLCGVGKTLLVEKTIAQIGDRFEGVVWRSLHSHTLLPDLSSSILSSLGIRQTEGQTALAPAQLVALMAQRPLLIVLEGAEALLQPGALAGDYRRAHQAYGEFFQSVMGSRSCVVVTGIEGPADLVRQGSYSQRQGVRSLYLKGLPEAAAIMLLQAESVEQQQSAEYWPELIARYQGHPLALKAATRVIQEIFNGRVDQFLQQGSVLFTDILRLLSPSFERLSASELSILYWLASQDEPMSLRELQQTLPRPVAANELISALDSLKQRSLLGINTRSDLPTFYLPALVKAYAVHRFMNRFREGRSANVTGAVGAGEVTARSGDRSSAYTDLDQVIDLSPPAATRVQLSQWFQGQFEADWQSLNRLFEASARPSMRLRNAYHLQDETFIKRCKSIVLSESNQADNQASDQVGNQGESIQAAAVLLVAVHPDGENLYKVCVQAQPAKEASVLPEHLALKLLDNQQAVLATVVAGQSDTFIQLPYFRGATTESFSIELSLQANHHTETFVI